MRLIRSEKFAALVILTAALLGFALANSPLSHSYEHLIHREISFGISLSIAHWVSELGLTFFFVLIGVELRHEFEHGSFKNPSNAVPPLVAAVLGVLVPAGLYVLMNMSSAETLRGWAVPTATDVTFALAIFLLFGSRMPKQARTFLLTIVVADDLIAILIIAIFFPENLNLLYLLASLPVLLVFGWLAKTKSGRFNAILLIALSLIGWALFLASGIHPVIAGVIIGLLLPEHKASYVSKWISLPTNLLILPIFAAFSAAVPVENVGHLGGVFFGILLGPVGKVIGITVGGAIGYRLIKSNDGLSLVDLARLGALGGIGFTVSLLVAQLSFRANEELANQATFGVLVASVLTMLFGAVFLATAKRT